MSGWTEFWKDMGRAFSAPFRPSTPRPRPKPPIVITPVPPAPKPNAGEVGRITIHDRQFWSEDGKPWTWAGATDFCLFGRYLEGQDIIPQIEQRIAVGAKVLRVFGMIDQFGKSRTESFAHIYPQEHPDYYEKLTAFVNLLTLSGLRVEFVLFADAAAVMPDPQQQDDYAERAFLAIESAAPGFTKFIEAGNEVMFEANLPGGEARAYEIGRRFQGRSQDILISSGCYDLDAHRGEPTFPYVCDYFTEHNDRSDEWARKQIDLSLHRDGFTENEWVFQGVRVPVVSDEPRGMDETVWGSRTTNTVAAGHAGGVAAMMGNGITFHSTAGLMSEVFGPIQTAGAKAMLTAARFIPAEVQRLPYSRGSDQGVCAWAYGPSPVEHDEGAGKRSYAKWLGNDFWVVQAGSDRPFMTVCAGFELISEPVQGIAHLRQV